MVDLSALDAGTRRGALAHRASGPAAGVPRLQADGLRLAEIAHTGKIVLRGNPDDRGFMAAAGTALGMVLPGETGAVTTVQGAAGPVTVIGIAFDEWWVVCPEGAEGRLLAGLETQLAGQHFQATDITDSRTVIRVDGRHARDLLEKGCAIDLHDRAFPDGRAASVPVALADTLLHRCDDSHPDEGSDPGVESALGYDIYVLRSFADYLWTWLTDAAVEFR